jgi:hypothetical protein
MIPSVTEPGRSGSETISLSEFTSKTNYKDVESARKVIAFLIENDKILNDQKGRGRTPTEIETRNALEIIKHRLTKKAGFGEDVIEALVSLECIHHLFTAKEKVGLALKNPNLQQLVLHNTDLNNSQLKLIAENCRHLKSLNIRRCNDITKEGFEILNQFSEVTELYLSMCKNISNDALKCLPHHLEKLWLRRCREISLEGINHLVSSDTLTKSLHTLVIRGCKITDKCLESIVSLKNLKALDLHRCREITDEGLGHLLGCTQLEELNLRECTKITEAGLKSIESLPLTSLTIKGCPALKETDVVTALKSRGVTIKDKE